MVVILCEVLSVFFQFVLCVGCCCSVECFFFQFVEFGNFVFEFLIVGFKGVLFVIRSCMIDVKKFYILFYVYGFKLNDMIDVILKSKKNKRCQLYFLDMYKLKFLGGCWMDVWELMLQECRDEVVLIDLSCFLEILEIYL